MVTGRGGVAGSVNGWVNEAGHRVAVTEENGGSLEGREELGVEGC